MQLDLASDVAKLKETLGPLPEAMVEPPLIVLSGLPGTGKSYFSLRLADRLPAVILGSDILRQHLFGEPTYSAEESARLFQACHGLIDELLSQGIPVIFDATNLSEGKREILYHIAQKRSAKLILVRVEAPLELVQQRLEGRTAGQDSEDHSEADWRVYHRMRSLVQPIARRHFAVDTSRDINPVIEKILREVRR